MFHKSNLGCFGVSLPSDRDGYVPEEHDDAFAGNWDHEEETHDDDEELTEYGEYWQDVGFPKIVERAKSAIRKAENKINEWRATRKE